MPINTFSQSAALAAVAALVLAGCKPAAPAEKAAPGAAAAALAAGALTVKAQPDLGPENQAMPRFEGGDAAATARINAAMDRLDAATKEGLTSCPDMPHAGQSQKVKVTRRGPIVAIEVEYESDCGAYPSSGINSFVFDAATGGVLDWKKALPGAQIVNGEPDVEYSTNSFTSPVLQTRIVAAAQKETDAQWKTDCLPVLQGGDASLTARFNTETGLLDITPDLVHAVQACATTISLSVDDLKALQADPRVIAATHKG